MDKILITGSGGLVGSEAVSFFCKLGYKVLGIDNDSRGYFFGNNGSTKPVIKELVRKYKYFRNYSFDIRDNIKLKNLFKSNKFKLIIHAAAQPSHDWASKEPITDFTINALGTAYILDNFRLYNSDAVFIFVSTNKVYGDRPNTLPFTELKTRFEIDKKNKYVKGINESMNIDNCLHSLMGASKTTADILTQEYGKYFGLQTSVFRAGCITGPSHKGVELHGFLNYLVKCVVNGDIYHIFGYKGKQVRDNIHSSDLINAFYHFFLHPRTAEIYNIGGGPHSHCSVLEAISLTEKISHRKAKYDFINTPRLGDHKWYITDYSKFKKHYPNWKPVYKLNNIIEELVFYYLKNSRTSHKYNKNGKPLFTARV